MVHWSSRIIPFLALAIAVGCLYYNIDLVKIMPLLAPLGLGGIANSVLTKAVGFRQSLPFTPEQIQKIVSALQS